MKHFWSKALLFAMLVSGFVAIKASAAEEWYEVDVAMAVPDGVNFPGNIYVMYTGDATDLFADLNSENSFHTTMKALPGTYSVYQITPSFDSEYEFLATSSFTVKDNSTKVHVYIRGMEGLINEEITEEETPTDLASMGDKIASEVEKRQAEENEKLMTKQVVEASSLGDTANQSQEQTDELKQPPERNTGISELTGTEDLRIDNNLGYMIAGAVIIGLGLLAIIFVLIRKTKRGK